MSKILIIGRNGQLSRALQKACVQKSIHFELIGSADINLAKTPQSIAEIIQKSSGRAVINASAYTQVDTAETEIDLAQNLNTYAPNFMAQACKSRDIPFIHLSTDYVFNGMANTPYKPCDKCDPVNRYGHTKAEGERALFETGGNTTIIRTSWVYDEKGKNFLTTMLKLGTERDTLTVVDDQIGRPTYAGHLAEACLQVLRPEPNEPLDLRTHNTNPRIFHVTNSGDPISWYTFARAIFAYAGIDCTVTPIPTRDYPTPAQRPAYSVLDLSDFETAFSYRLPTWQDGLRTALQARPTPKAI